MMIHGPGFSSLSLTLSFSRRSNLSCYAQAILDLDGSNSITQEEFLAAANEFIRLEKTTTEVASEEVRETLIVCAR